MTLLARTPESKMVYDRAQRDSRKWDPRLEKTTRTGAGTYTVIGRTGVYTVTVDVNGFHCNCLAGMNDLTCWHTASVFRLRAAQRSARPVAAPSATAPVFDLLAAFDRAGITI